MSDTRRRSMGLGGALMTTSVAIAALLISTSSQAAAIPGANRGSFSSVCQFSHALHDDPIVNPGQPGAAHLHDFFGNTTTDADSTYESLRTSDTTCDRTRDTAAYWAPALYQDGKVAPPGQMALYYRGAQKKPATIRPFPSDLRMIAGDAANTDLAKSVATWSCAPLGLGNPEQGCPFGSHLRMSLPFPDCWDGERLDSPDHKSHMAYAEQASGPRVCPTSHPVPVPMLVLEIPYPDAKGGSGWSLSSGSPATAHADFINSWHQDTLEGLVNLCIKRGAGIGFGPIC